MKLITEEMVRGVTEGSEYLLPQGSILSPAAQETLRVRHVTVVRPQRWVQRSHTPVPGGPVKSYVNRETGARMAEKPEVMTQLLGDQLVRKDHPRIVFRGRVDLLQSRMVTAQVLMEERGTDGRLVEELEELVGFLRELLRAEVLDEPPRVERLLGLTPAELREQSHYPMKYFGVEPMTLPHRSMGLPYALLNELRAESRALETVGVTAFREGTTPAQGEILRWLNRLSSALHILMCRVLAGQYGG